MSQTENRFTHLGEDDQPRMVDVSEKEVEWCQKEECQGGEAREDLKPPRTVPAQNRQNGN